MTSYRSKVNSGVDEKAPYILYERKIESKIRLKGTT